MRFRSWRSRRTPRRRLRSFRCSGSPWGPPSSIRSRRASGSCSPRPTASARRISPVARSSSARFRSRRFAPGGRQLHSRSLPPDSRPMLGAMAELQPAYLLAGTDRPKVARAVRRLRDRIGEDATELLSASEADGNDVAAACNALGLFASERRLVVVEDVEAWKAAEVEPVLGYLKSPSPETVLALVGSGIRKDSALAKAVAKAGEVLVYDLPRRGNKADLPGWVGRQFAAQGVRVDPAVSRLLVELVGDNLDELASEVEKLVAWADGETI